ncbi:MAG: hypothetical protein RR954_08275 [Christensenellaceae bacterium]
MIVSFQTVSQAIYCEQAPMPHTALKFATITKRIGVTMSDFGEEVKKMILAGVGAAAITAEKSKEMLAELVQKGELTVEQGKVLNEELKRDTSDKVKKAVAAVQPAEPVKKIAARIGEMSPEERALLRQKLDEAEAVASENADTASEDKAEEA